MTLVPLVWLLSVTVTAGVQKIFHSSPRIGFLSAAEVLQKQRPALEQALEIARQSGIAETISAAEKALRTNTAQIFNNMLDAFVAGSFLVLVAAIVLLSAREWILLFARKRVARLSETEPVWLPDYAVAEARPLHVASLIALAIALARELSGEERVDRLQQAAVTEVSHLSVGQASCLSSKPARQGQAGCLSHTRASAYVRATEERFNGINRCC